MKLITLLLFLTLFATGCGNDTAVDAENAVNEPEEIPEEFEKMNDDKFKENSMLWASYMDLDYTETFDGLELNLENISFGSEDDEHYIAIKVNLLSRSNTDFTSYPEQASLTLDNGEKIDILDLIASFEDGSYKFESKGDTLEGFYAWEIMTDPDDIEKVEIKWSNYKNPDTDYMDWHDFKVSVTIER